MVEWLTVAAVLTVFGVLLWRFAAYARRIEQDSVDMGDELRRPYGYKFLAILHGHGNDE